MSGIVVRALAIAPVKGMRLLPVSRVSLGPAGVHENRRFFWIDERDRMVNGKQLGELQRVVAEYTAGSPRGLSLRFPGGTVIEDEIRSGPEIVCRFFSRSRAGQLVAGPWSDAVSAFLGRRLRLVEAGDTGAVDRGTDASASLISRASLERLGDIAAPGGKLDARRFRMLIEVDGVPAHAEDSWVGRRVRVGSAVITFRGHVGRCLVTSRDPESGVIDVPTLDSLGSYRGGLPTTEPLAFGIYGGTAFPGAIAVGDSVVVDGTQ